MELKLKAPGKISGDIILEGSKSISNRLLIMRALSEGSFDIENLSPSDDTKTLMRLLNKEDLLFDVGAAGTTMRFLTAYFSIIPGERILTGSERMKKRPVKILVDALRELGADIEYLEKEGYPPIKISGRKIHGGKITIRADISSQYISALLMIGPVLENGLELELDGKISSQPYINMTLEMMAAMGIEYSINENVIKVIPGKYISKPMKAESDWSAASYYFSICALSAGSSINIHGLFPESLQGDSVLPQLYEQLGVHAVFDGDILNLQHNGIIADEIAIDFSNCPDLAQTIAVSCAALGVKGKFTGVESLKIKETDRTLALSKELKKFGVDFHEQDEQWILTGNSASDKIISIDTYEDHRMAMSFAPLSIKHNEIIIHDPDVIKKSYPSFWSNLMSLGFSVSFS
ncbi:MAG: 3-phosphoshikimate 1-carboxyvinyltransferase [Chitinophagales bacterium]